MLTIFLSRRGPTRKETAISEAQSYANIALINNYWNLLSNDSRAGNVDDILIEDRALDSYHNVLFSLTLFYTHFRRWPQHMTIVSHGFKKPRLVDGHCTAIGYPLDRVSFVGIDPPGMAAGAQDKQAALDGVSMALGEWREDPHGRGESLAGKRTRRNPYGVWQGVFGQGEVERGGLVLKGEVLDEEATRPWL